MRNTRESSLYLFWRFCKSCVYEQWVGSTNRLLPQASIVGQGDHRRMKVVQVNLAFGLKFVEEIEETKGEGSAWPAPGGREPPSTE